MSLTWADLISDIAERLRELDDAPVQTNAEAKVPDCALLAVRRGVVNEQQTFAIDSDGVAAVAVECWEYDRDDYDAANSRLAALERSVVDVLETYAQALPELRRVAALISIRIEPDGDLFRPAVGSEITATIAWRSL